MYKNILVTTDGSEFAERGSSTHLNWHIKSVRR